MARIRAGVVAVALAALLVAGCGGGGSKLSPAQKERCEELKGKLADAKKKGPSTVEGLRLLEERKKEYASLAC